MKTNYVDISKSLYNVVISHSDEKTDFKYYAKVPIDSKRDRYFYSKEEYLAYMRNKNRGEKKPISTADRVNESASSTHIGETKKDSSQLVDKAVDMVSFLLGGKLGQTLVRNIREKIDANEQYEQQMAELKEHNPLPQLKIKSEPTTKDEDQGAINPMYDGMTYEWSNNCSYCTMAYDLRQRGYDVVANPADPEDLVYIPDIISWYDGAEPKDVASLAEESGIPLEELTQYHAAQLLEEDLLKEGEGARGHFIVDWSNGGAHDVIWEVENGEVWLRDCQSNEKLKPLYYIQYASYFTYFRTDNIMPNEKCLRTISNKK